MENNKSPLIKHIEEIIEKLNDEHKKFVEKCQQTGRAYYELDNL
jgi:hypothetical protein